MKTFLLAAVGIGLWGQGTITTLPVTVYRPYAVSVDAGGTLYYRESQYQVKKLSPGGAVGVAIGTGVRGFSGDGGPATAAQISTNGGVVFDAAGNGYLPDQFNGRVRRVGRDGIIQTVAGNGSFFSSGDGGPATEAGLISPIDVAVDGAGNLYICDESAHRVRKVGVDGKISTIAGNGTMGYSGDGGPATAAQLRFPRAVAVDGAGNVFIADPLNQRVRRVTPDGKISTWVGTGEQGGSGDGGPGTQATLYFPRHVRVDGKGNLLITEQYGSRVRRVTPEGIISTVAGNGTYSYGGDYGPGPLAGLNGPDSAAVDAAGNIYIADMGNSAIRKVTAGPVAVPSVVETGAVSVFGVSPVITVRVSHPDGAGQIGIVNVLINRELDGAGACYVAWDQQRGVMYLVTDDGRSLTEGLTLGRGTGTVANSQCRVFAAGSSAAVAGNVLTLSLSVSFASGFTGNKVIHVAARDVRETTAGWKGVGVARIPETGVSGPRALEMTPEGGAGPAGMLTVTFDDVASIRTAFVLVNSGLVAAKGCALAYSGGTLYLRPDTGYATELRSVALGGAGTVENSQCRVTAANSRAVRVGNQLRLELDMTFSPYFYGPQMVWGGVETTGGLGSGWRALGAWIVP